jgi:hypothetical protein
MAKQSAKQKIAELRKRLSGRLKIISQEVATELVDVIIDVVKQRTRQEGEGAKGSLKALERSTIKFRERYSNRLHPDTSPSKSNLTATGQLIDAIRGKAVQGKVKIDIKPGTRKAGITGKRSKDKISNEDVRKYVEDAGREFLALSTDEKKELDALTIDLIKEKLRDLLR